MLLGRLEMLALMKGGLSMGPSPACPRLRQRVSNAASIARACVCVCCVVESVFVVGGEAPLLWATDRVLC